MVLFVTITMGCNDSKNNNKESNNVTQSKKEEFLTAKIDGVAYSFSDRVDLNSTAELSHIINGFNKETKTRITLGLNLDNKTTRAFELKDNIVLVYHAYLIYKEKKVKYIWHTKKSVPSSTGTITITKNNDTYLEGTFLFNGVGGTKIDRSIKKVTEGKFRVLKK